MDKSLKKIIIGLLVIATIVLIGYTGYKLYEYAVQDATKRIKRGVAEGVGEGIGDAINPLSLPSKILGGKD